MKTDELIGMLARGAGPAPRAVVARRLAPAGVAGLLASAVLALAILGLVPQEMFATPAPWFKLGYAGAMAAAAAWLTARLSRPVARLEAPSWGVAAVALVAGLLGVMAWANTPSADRLSGLLGHSWARCPWTILLLSLPGLVGAVWALRGLAPTRPRAAGFAAGLMAGALGAFGYAFSCTEVALSFVSLWYSLGIGLAALLGSWLGPRVLRW
jgi:hypothetical protein